MNYCGSFYTEECGLHLSMVTVCKVCTFSRVFRFFLLFWFNTQVRRHSKTLILLTNIDQKSLETEFLPTIFDLRSSIVKETKSATMNIFQNFYFLFKSFVKVELSYVFTINLFTIAENCTEK